MPANIYLAKDTRSNSQDLANAALEGIKVLQGEVKDFGLLTTPQLHYVVCCKNNPSYGCPTINGYYEKYSSAFNKLRGDNLSAPGNYNPYIYVDCANGVGAFKLKEISPQLKYMTIKIFNDGSAGILNYKCGADFVKVQQTIPEGDIIPNERYASFDGDADRLVYFYIDDQNVFHLLDGDKIATLIAKCLKKFVQDAELNVSLRVIQTAYANGSSTDYIENILKIPVICVPTGVKHLHHEAQKYDIGIYFEANGHGTVVYSEEIKSQLRLLQKNLNATNEQQKAAAKILDIIDLTNEIVGDAITDLLLVENFLFYSQWGISDWYSIYVDRPNRQLKVKIPDRNMITTTNAERVCVKPKGLQEKINELISKYDKSRAFIRPSGTEDIVRVYAEADTQEHADQLAKEIGAEVEKFAAKK